MEQLQYHQLSLRDKFIYTRWAYSVGMPVISDAEYTLLLEAMKSEFPNDEYVKRSWSSDPCPTDLLKSLGRDDLIYKVILSDKTESIPSLGSESEVYYTLSSISGPGTLSMKHDGWNIQISYARGSIVMVHTRGRSSDAIDVSSLKNYFPQSIPYEGNCKIVLEMTVSKSNYGFCASMFNNVSERSAVSSILARPEYYHMLSFNAFDIHGYELNGRCKFEVLQEWGFSTPMWKSVTDYQSMLIALHELSDAADDYDEPTDGAVYDGVMRRAIRIMHWQEPIYKSFVTGYNEKFGPYRISPSVEIYPVLRKGSTQHQLSMTNWQRIIDYNLQPGAPLAFRIASDATADFDEESTVLLQEQYVNRWDVFQQQIKESEAIARWQRENYLNGLYQ